MKGFIAVLLLLVGLPALAQPASVVSSLRKASMARYELPRRPGLESDPVQRQLYSHCRYNIVPYRDKFFATTTHSVRGPAAFAVWEYVNGRWSWIFDYSERDDISPAEYRRTVREAYRRAGFSDAMRRSLETGPFRIYPGLPGVNPALHPPVTERIND